MIPYRPHPLLRSGHLQTLMVGVLTGRRYPYHARPRRVPLLADDEALIVHEERGPPVAENAPLAILLHGLGGDHRSAYLERLAPRLRRQGRMVWRVDLRGCGAGISDAWRPAHAGASADLACVIREARRCHPQRPIDVAGFSLSGNILLKLLGELASGQFASSQVMPDVDATSIRSAIAVAPPIDLQRCSDNMDRWSRKIYTHYYLKVLHEQVQLRRRQWPQWQRIPEDPAIKTIRQFDARYTAPLNGFLSTGDYYARSSAAPWLPHICTPTTVLIDRHDPIVAFESLQAAKWNPASTRVVSTRRGGHMGYFGLDDQGRLIRWMEYFVEQLLRQLPT